MEVMAPVDGPTANPAALSAFHASTGANADLDDKRRAGRSGNNMELAGPEGLEPLTGPL